MVYSVDMDRKKHYTPAERAEILEAIAVRRGKDPALSFASAAQWAARQHGVAAETLCRWRRLARSGAALARKPRSDRGQGRVEITPMALEFALHAYYQRGEPSMASVISLVRERAPRMRWTLPSDKTLARRVRDARTPERLARRFGLDDDTGEAGEFLFG